MGHHDCTQPYVNVVLVSIRILIPINKAHTNFFLLSVSRLMVLSYQTHKEHVLAGGNSLPQAICVEPSPPFLCLETQATALLLRMGVWLRDTNLFEEAWDHVMSDPRRWFVSAETFVFAVGTWAFFTRVYGEPSHQTHKWQGLSSSQQESNMMFPIFGPM
jgi:hypothetical protein